jgi:hypothetical protein
MFATLLRKLRPSSRNGSRSRQLEVEALEGRFVPSTLGTLVRSAADVVKPPSPPGGSHVRELEPLGGSTIAIVASGGALDPSGDVTPLAGNPLMEGGGTGSGRHAASSGDAGLLSDKATPILFRHSAGGGTVGPNASSALFSAWSGDGDDDGPNGGETPTLAKKSPGLFGPSRS